MLSSGFIFTGGYLVRGEFAATAGTRLRLSVGEEKIEFDVPHTGGWENAKKIEVGTVTFAKDGVYHLSLEAADPVNWKAANVWGVELVPSR